MELVNNEPAPNNNNNKQHTTNNIYTYIYSTTNPETFSVSRKIFRGFKISEELAKSWKIYCNYLNVNMSEAVEIAMMDFMKKHLEKIPVDASFSLIPQKVVENKKMVCGYNSCLNAAVGKGVWRTKEFLMCEDHYKMAQQNPKDWKNLELI